MAQTVLKVALRTGLALMSQNPAKQQAMQDKIERILERHAKRAAQATALAIRIAAPVDTGALRDSITIRYKRTDDFIGYSVVVPKEEFGDDRDYYPAYLEYGWRYKPEGVPFFNPGIDASRGTRRIIMLSAEQKVLQALNSGRIT